MDLSSATEPIFGFDDDGICDPSTWPGPPGNGPAPGCPGPSGFGPTGYEGPNNTFDNISGGHHVRARGVHEPDSAGRIGVLGPGGAALGADVNVGSVAGACCGSVNASATSYKPMRSLTPMVPGVRAWVYVDTPRSSSSTHR